MSESEEVIVNSSTVLLWKNYRTAQYAKSSWTAEEKRLKAELLEALGYDPEDEKPPACTAVTDNGEKVFEVKVGTRRGLDTKYFRDTHPDVYAESEKTTHPISINEV